MARPSVLLADDHTAVREGLVRIIEKVFDVLGAVADGRALVTEAERLRPDVVVLDVGMPLLNGIEAATQIRQKAQDTKLVFLTQQSGKEYVRAAFRIGALAYVLKNAAAVELVTAISEAANGRRYLSAELRQRFGPPDPFAAMDSGPLFGTALTETQRKVLRLFAEGKTAKEIAHALHFSTRTVEFHTAAIMDELGLRTTAELARYAVEHGIVTGPA